MKARELLKASRSKALIPTTEVRQVENVTVNKKYEDINQIDSIEQELNKLLHGNTTTIEKDVKNDKENISVQEKIEEKKSNQTHFILEQKEKEKVYDNTVKVNEKSKLGDRLALFDTKPKSNTVHKPAAVNPLLGRMNKEKEPMKLTHIKSNEKQVEVKTGHNDNLKDNDHHNNEIKTDFQLKEDDNITTNVPERHILDLPPTKNEDKAKLMKRIATAKAVNSHTKQGLGMKKQSEKIMGMADKLQNKLNNNTDSVQLEVNKMLGGENSVKMKFLLNDDDVQHYDENNSRSVGPKIENKDVIEILLEKPTKKKFVKKKTISTFVFSEDN